MKILSFLEAKYISALCATQQTIQMRRIMEESNFISSSLAMFYCDNN